MTKHLVSAMTLYIFASFAMTVSAQSKSVEFRFEVDGVPKKGSPRVVFYAGHENLEAAISGNNFVVPPSLYKYEKVDVRFISGEYNLLFESVYLSKFEGDWVIGVDRKPFDKGNTAAAQPCRQIREIHYINFNSLQGDGTRMMVITYKK